eukprot:15046922-Alexandrium_andersonii.AAC.1
MKADCAASARLGARAESSKLNESSELNCRLRPQQIRLRRGPSAPRVWAAQAPAGTGSSASG